MFRPLSSLGGSALIVYAASAVVASKYTDVSTSLVWWVQVVLCVLAGIAIVLLPDFLKKNNIFKTNSEDNFEFDDNVITSAVHHLAERLSTSPEGVELCKQLQNYLFELHHKDDVEDTQEPTNE
jgi:hypothetical protein